MRTVQNPIIASAKVHQSSPAAKSLFQMPFKDLNKLKAIPLSDRRRREPLKARRNAFPLSERFPLKQSKKWGEPRVEPQQ